MILYRRRILYSFKRCFEDFFLSEAMVILSVTWADILALDWSLCFYEIDLEYQGDSGIPRSKDSLELK